VFKKILVANRGEIAVRVIRACHELGVAAVAVYSDADAHAAHVREADEAYRLGPAAPAESYLNAERIFAVAGEANCDALHPGYGFLAESAAFASACVGSQAHRSIRWIGPSPKIISLMGDKIAARRAAQKSGMPVVPGTSEPLRIGDDLQKIARGIGYPVAIKAAAGGGGKGLRVARDAREVEQAMRLAAREAAAYFGDATLYVERYLANPKHVEVQVFGDAHGHLVHLGERDCSMQRRHQKLVEETPARIGDGLRSRLIDAAVGLARGIGYDSAGTIECLVDGTEFFFLEMNTRIQVEHTVTEMTWGVDLVKAQIRVAAGEPLWFAQSDVSPRGHAIECRINAESPAQGFRPSPGEITAFSAPSGPGVRVDTAAFAGSLIPPEYDSLIAKLVVWGADRDEARARAVRALREFEVRGVETTIPFLKLLVADPEFARGTYTTPTVERFVQDRAEEVAAAYPAPVTSERRGEDKSTTQLAVDVNGKRFTVRIYGRASSTSTRAGRPRSTSTDLMAGRARPSSPKRLNTDSGVIESPMHGIVTEVRAKSGDLVEDGQVVAVIEAMKMMNEIVAHRTGTIGSVEVNIGETVETGSRLLTYAE